VSKKVKLVLVAGLGAIASLICWLVPDPIPLLDEIAVPAVTVIVPLISAIKNKKRDHDPKDDEK